MIIETLIIAAALYFGLSSIGDAIDNVAVSIEQASLNQLALFQDDEEND